MFSVIQIEESSSLPIEKCISVYKATIMWNNSTELTQLYGYDQLVLKTNKLQRNTLYTIELNQITSNKNISLQPLNFSEFLC